MNRFKNQLLMAAGFAVLAGLISGSTAAPAIAAAIKAALVQNVDEPGRHPILWHAGGVNGVSLPVVPANKRAVITQISAQAIASGPNNIQVFVRDSGLGVDARFDYPMVTNPNSPSFQELTAPMHSYVRAGSHLDVSTWTASSEQSIEVTVTGYMIDCTTAGSCDAF